MPRKKQESSATPAWLITMGDMSLLLMVFFVLLFSVMISDRDKYLKLEEALKSLSMVGKVERERSSNLEGETAAENFKVYSPANSGDVEKKLPEGVYLKTQRVEEGTVHTIAGENHAFPEGRWELTPQQRTALVEIKRWMWGRRNIIEIRGHVSSNIEDSVVVEGGTYRPFDKARDMKRADRWDVVDHSLLSYLRARAVKEFFTEAHPAFGDDMEFKEMQLRVRAESYTRNLADSILPVDRVVNRRIEVVATPDILED